MQIRKLVIWITTLLTLLSYKLAFASVVVPMYLVDANAQGKSIGSIKFEDSSRGVIITPSLHDLSSGIHGLHIHDKPDCKDNGMAARGHLDPTNTKMHSGPYQNTGHLGDLPALIVNKDGNATLPRLAPRFKLADITGHALMIHAGGDNYSDKPEKLGGGGERIACGIINKQ